VIEPDPSSLTEDQQASVDKLTISNPGIGSISFTGPVDIRGLDFEAVVQLHIGEVLVYPDAEQKPPPGEGLNRAAVVTLQQCWPSDDPHALMDPGKAEKYRRKIKAMTEKKNATFVDYDCNTGVWVFQVEQF
jgi:nuclear pore complex protein Nup98-Nup96